MTTDIGSGIFLHGDPYVELRVTCEDFVSGFWYEDFVEQRDDMQWPDLDQSSSWSSPSGASVTMSDPYSPSVEATMGSLIMLKAPFEDAEMDQ